MSIREDLVQSAVSFLQDPSVANSPLDKRIAFLQSKNLTQEEIDASLARAGGDPQGPPPASYGYPQQQLTRQQQPQYGYGQYPPGYWQQPPPPEPPRRDWRDYFIMATVVSGLSYGAYFLAKRYVVPLIAPPTPPQLEQDKASIDESFNRAFTLIDQLSTDTAAIKESEEARKEKLDAAISDMESVVEEMKIAARRRDDDSRRLNEDVRSLQGLIPKAMKAQEENTDNRIRELNMELKSLKTLISNRMSGQGVAQTAVQRGPNPSGFGASGSPGANMYGPQGTASVNGSAEGAPAASAASAAGSATPATSNEAAAAGPTPDRSSTSSPMYKFGGSRGIPAWQMAAAKKAEEARKDASDGDAASSIVS